MRKLLVLMMIPLLSGCDKVVDFGEYLFFGYRNNLLVIESTSIEIQEQGVYFVLSDPMKLVGDTFSLCLAFMGGVDTGSQEESRQLLDQLTNEGIVKGDVTLSNGITLNDSGVLMSWHRDGYIFSEKEFSGCLHYSISAYDDIELYVQEVSISSTSPFYTGGIYLESNNYFDE